MTGLSKSLSPSPARWIWSDAGAPAPKNRYTYFRKSFNLDALPKEASLLFAANSTARLFINGHVVRRKVARFVESHITAECVDAARYLRVGANVIVALHHNWGDIVCFQRTGNTQAGLYISSSFVNSDTSWQTLTAPEFPAHEVRCAGRLRYVVVLDARGQVQGDIHDPRTVFPEWPAAIDVTGRLPRPMPVETPGQREYFVAPPKLLAAGIATSEQPRTTAPAEIAAQIRARALTPQPALARSIARLTSGSPITITGKAGQTLYATFDFFRPVHGYVALDIAAATSGVVIDVGYGELPHSLYSGKVHMRPDGWIDTVGVVGKSYADRIITRAGAQYAEIPDERTARWLTLHITFPADGSVTFRSLGIIDSQYPVTPVGTFECGDDRIKQIVDLCLIHARVTMTDAYVDTPGREDGQWIEDDVPRAELAARYFNDTALRRFLIRSHAQQQNEAGDLHPFAPSNYPFGPAHYDWSVQWVGAIYDHYRWTADLDLVRQVWPNLIKYWQTVLRPVDPVGLWRTNHVLCDIRANLPPASERQSSGMVTPRVIQRLGHSVELARALGAHDLAATWQALHDRMVTAFRTHHLIQPRDGVPLHVADRTDPDDPALTRGHSQGAQVLAIVTGLLTPAEARAECDYVFAEPFGSPPPGVVRWNNPTSGYVALAALAHNGLSNRAVRHLLERYEPYLTGSYRNLTPEPLQSPFSGPLPEYWISREDLGLAPDQLNSTQPVDETGSHGWGALPLLFFHEHLLGIQILTPGGSRLRITPDAAGLPYVAGHSAVPTGLLFVLWDPQQSLLEVHLPPNTAAEILPPRDAPNTRLQPVTFPVAPTSDTGSAAQFIASPGRYVFSVVPV